MKKYLSNHGLLSGHFSFPGKTVIDVGCGGGDTVRWLAAQGTLVTGLDSREMLAKARSHPAAAGEKYIEGGAQKLPFADGTADIILYLASFHHVPSTALSQAMNECCRVLKMGGRAVFVEPVYRTGAYTEVTRLVEDEAEVQKKAYATITSPAHSDLAMEKEDFFFMERSFEDYVRLIEFFVDDPGRRATILAQAREITSRFSAQARQNFDDFRYRSICRLNIMEKIPV
jgi:ubiquinone/menaquinone biosynthesis C-methylase UbiE